MKNITNYLKISALLFSLPLLMSCEKEELLDDSTVYQWKKETVVRNNFNYSEAKTGTVPFVNNPDFSMNGTVTVLDKVNKIVKVEFVYLTPLQKKREEQKIQSEYNGYVFYIFTRVK